MLNISHADHLNLNVKNLDQTIQFYHKLFGFEVREQGEHNGNPYAIIGKERVFFLCLYERGEVSQLGHIGLHVKNFDEVEKVLKELGVKIEIEYEYPESRSIYINDPNGIEIELSENFGGLKS